MKFLVAASLVFTAGAIEHTPMFKNCEWGYDNGPTYTCALCIEQGDATEACSESMKARYNEVGTLEMQGCVPFTFPVEGDLCFKYDCIFGQATCDDSGATSFNGQPCDSIFSLGQRGVHVDCSAVNGPSFGDVSAAISTASDATEPEPGQVILPSDDCEWGASGKFSCDMCFEAEGATDKCTKMNGELTMAGAEVQGCIPFDEPSGDLCFKTKCNLSTGECECGTEEGTLAWNGESCTTCEMNLSTQAGKVACSSVGGPDFETAASSVDPSTGKSAAKFENCEWGYDKGVTYTCELCIDDANDSKACSKTNVARYKDGSLDMQGCVKLSEGDLCFKYDCAFGQSVCEDTGVMAFKGQPCESIFSLGEKGVHVDCSAVDGPSFGDISAVSSASDVPLSGQVAIPSDCEWGASGKFSCDICAFGAHKGVKEECTKMNGELTTEGAEVQGCIPFDEPSGDLCFKTKCNLSTGECECGTEEGTLAWNGESCTTCEMNLSSQAAKVTCSSVGGPNFDTASDVDDDSGAGKLFSALLLNVLMLAVVLVVMA